MIQTLKKRRIFAFIFFLLIAIEIVFVSSIPGTKAGTGLSWPAVAYHLTAFFLLGFSFLVLITGNQKARIEHILIAIIIPVTYAIFDEIHQKFVPMRSCSLSDLLTDSIGIFCAILVCMISERKR